MSKWPWMVGGTSASLGARTLRSRLRKTTFFCVGLINSDSPSNQKSTRSTPSDPDIATNSRGNTLIVWEDDFEAPNDPDVRMLRLTSFRESSPYDLWADSFGDPTVLDPDGDSDGDGLCNLKEYIMNLNPLVPDAHLAPDPTFSYDSQSGIVGITLPWRERNDDESIVVEIEESTDLETWTVIGTMISLGMIDELTDLKSSDLFFDASEGRRHLRLRFSLQPVD